MNRAKISKVSRSLWKVHSGAFIYGSVESKSLAIQLRRAVRKGVNFEN